MDDRQTVPDLLLHLSHLARWVIGIVAASILSGLAWAPAHAIIIDGLNADKQNFLAYLINQGASGNNATFAYAGPNANQDGPADLISGAGATSNFGARMATAAGAANNALTVHVGRNIPRIFFGAFEWDPAVGGNQAGHQTIDLADIFAVPVRNPNLEGGTDILLHEIFEGIAGLGGGGFAPSHFISGFQEENSNRAADGSKGIRVIPQPRADTLVVNPVNGDVTFRTAWRITTVPLRDGDLVIRGKVVGGANYTINSIQFGLLPAGIDDGTRFDVQFVDQFFVDAAGVPEPGSLPLMLAGMGIAAAMLWRRRSKELRVLQEDCIMDIQGMNADDVTKQAARIKTSGLTPLLLSLFTLCAVFAPMNANAIPIVTVFNFPVPVLPDRDNKTTGANDSQGWGGLFITFNEEITKATVTASPVLADCVPGVYAPVRVDGEIGTLPQKSFFWRCNAGKNYQLDSVKRPELTLTVTVESEKPLHPLLDPLNAADPTNTFWWQKVRFPLITDDPDTSDPSVFEFFKNARNRGPIKLAAQVPEPGTLPLMLVAISALWAAGSLRWYRVPG